MDRNNKTAWWGVGMMLLWLCILFLLGFCARVGWAHTGHDHIPPAAEKYRRTLIREVRYYFGFNEPISPFAGQLHQESGFRSGVCSRFACGLAQFTEGTAKDMARMYPKDLEGKATPLDPNWAIRAQALYMKRLDKNFKTPDKWETRAFALAAYNGGSGWILREKKLCLDDYDFDFPSSSCNPQRWFLHVERFCKRAAWACEENRAYPRKILFLWTPLYTKAGWR